MRVTVIENDNWDSDDSDEVFSLLKINEIYFDALLDLKQKDTFTQEDRCHEDFTKFYKRFYKEGEKE